jgi:hypothetical protein
MDKYKTTTTINTWFSLINLEKLETSIQKKIEDFNRYRKKMKFHQALEIFLYAIHSQKESLRDIDASMVSKQFQKEVGMESISYSQLSRALKDMDSTILHSIFEQLLGEAHKESSKNKKKFYLVDSSTFSLNKTLYPWADFRKTKAGIKLHLKVCHMGKGQIHPKEFQITTADKHDNHFLDCFVNETLATYVFDRGYLDFDQLDKMNWDGYFFVTRVKKNTVIHQIQRLEPKGEGVLNDEIVRLGSKTSLTANFRLITFETENGRILEFVTNRFDLRAIEIAQMYQARWQIELFFKHIKQHMTIKNYFSTDEKGVTNQLYLAMIAYLLSFLIRIKTKTNKSLFQVVRQMIYLAYEPYQSFVETLNSA